MARMFITDFRSMEKSPMSPAVLRSRIGEMILHSTAPTLKFEVLNQDTGEYRIVLQGTLDKEESKWEEK